MTTRNNHPDRQQIDDKWRECYLSEVKYAHRVKALYNTLNRIYEDCIVEKDETFRPIRMAIRQLINVSKDEKERWDATIAQNLLLEMKGYPNMRGREPVFRLTELTQLCELRKFAKSEVSEFSSVYEILPFRK